MGMPYSKKTSIALSEDLRSILTSRHAHRGTLIDALRRVITDSGTLYGLPAPACEALRADMQKLGLVSQRDYMVWLLLERLRAVMGAAAADSSEAA